MERQQNKSGAYTLLSLDRIVNLLALIFGLVALLFSAQANSLSRQANSISEESNRVVEKSSSPEMLVQHRFSFRNYIDDYKSPCMATTGNAIWNIEFAAAFDITNLGGRALSLVDIQQPNNGKIETFHELTDATVRFDYFGTAEDFDVWYGDKLAPSSSWIEQSREKFDFSGPPIKIEAGETRRLLLRGGEFVRIDSSLTPQDVHQVLYDVTWNSNLSFMFADGSIKDVVVRVIHPYQFEPRKVAIDPFEKCAE